MCKLYKYGKSFKSFKFWSSMITNEYLVRLFVFFAKQYFTCCFLYVTLLIFVHFSLILENVSVNEPLRISAFFQPVLEQLTHMCIFHLITTMCLIS